MAQTPPADRELDTLLGYIYDRRNFDFRGYKRASLRRRISRRMLAVGVEDYRRYTDVLDADPSEFGELFNTILINVTSFLRDRDAWDAIVTLVLPRILRDKEAGDPIRAWSAGCASGEEAYTLAVLLAEAMGEDRFRNQVKIYGTDADTDALVQARLGRYPEKELVTALGEERTRRFFDVEQGYGTFRRDLRRSLVFGRHDLVQDSPISKIDLLACRNTLMYFTADVQQQILARFHFALNRGGFLFLGKSEALTARAHLFEPVDMRQHIFRMDGGSVDATVHPLPAPARTRPPPEIDEDGLADALLEQSPIAQVVVDARCNVLVANLQARRLLSIGSAEMGSPLDKGRLSLEPAELRRLVGVVLLERRTVTVGDVYQPSRVGEPVPFDVVLAPLADNERVAMAFVDVTRYRALSDALERSQRELRSAYEELQSTVEELETTNEELQSTNEELETMNEELHSSNEELESTNNELRVRSAEIADLNTFLQSILASLRSAVVVLGSEMEVRAWNRQAEDLWGLRAAEAHDQHFLSLDIGFPVETLGPVVRSCLAGRMETSKVTQEAVNRRGRTVECTVTVTRLAADDTVRGVILVMDTSPLADSSNPAQERAT